MISSQTNITFILGICLSVPGYMTDPNYLGPRPAPPGDWWVIVVGTKKSHDLQGRAVGQEAAKLRQLRKLGESLERRINQFQIKLNKIKL